jgi:hypothetical protein
MVEFRFATTVIYWRGPAPFFYAPIPAEQLERLRPAARAVTYGWGCVPVEATIGETVFTTSLFPKDGGYLLPVKAAVRKQTGITAGDTIDVVMTIDATER